MSQLIAAASFEALEELRTNARDVAIEGIMLKRRDSAYIAGRRAGLWYKWKRDPLTADCVLMYAQRGSGKRSSYYSDYTFGCWTDEGELLPVGKAYFGFTDEELKWLDRWVRAHTVQRFGPVREVEKALVLEVAFDSIHASSRHKSGLAMRFPANQPNPHRQAGRGGGPNRHAAGDGDITKRAGRSLRRPFRPLKEG